MNLAAGFRKAAIKYLEYAGLAAREYHRSHWHDLSAAEELEAPRPASGDKPAEPLPQTEDLP